MNPAYDSVDASDVEETEALRQSELVNRLGERIKQEFACGEVPLTQACLELSITRWLLDNNLVIKRDMR